MACANTQKVTLVAFKLVEERTFVTTKKGVPETQAGQQDRDRLCSQVEESLRYLLRHWNKVGEHFNCVKIHERFSTRNTTTKIL
ncbi:hypothetical protein CR513_24733, partial [Mucuna pruriens]